MIFGADLIIACPQCQALARVFSLHSGNSFGSITWTDGYVDTPMMPQPPRITRCSACGKIYWVGEAPPVGYLLPDTTEAANPAWVAAPHAEPLDEAGLFHALADGLAYSPDLELELRVAAWWRGNDAFRVEDAAVGHGTSPEAIANMERFTELLAETNEEDLLLFRAEALRHLGRFGEMEAALQGVACSDYRPAKLRLLELAQQGDRKLRVLFAAAEPGPLPGGPLDE